MTFILVCAGIITIALIAFVLVWEFLTDPGDDND